MSAALDDDHDHHDGEPGSLALWLQDNVVLHSVGVDIGSATTQVALARLHLRRHAEALTSRYVVVGKELVHDSGPRLTPYAADGQIAAEAVGEILDEAYARAGWGSDDVDTGAVILTGEALRRRNAEAVGAVVATRAGDLVCVTAGHHMEALLAAYGSGTVRRSHEDGSRLLNVDIGGGTTKITLVEAGTVVSTSAIHVGGRLIAVDDSGAVVRLEPGGRRHAASGGFTWQLGDVVPAADLAEVAELMAGAIVDALSGGAHQLFLTDRPDLSVPVDGVILSGGVAAYLNGTEAREFGDLGRPLAAALARHDDAGRLPGALLRGEESMRATVFGASEHTVQLSGITGRITNPDRSLPRRNLPVARVRPCVDETVDSAKVTQAVQDALTRRGVAAEDDLALAVGWSGAPSYARLSAFVRGLAAGLGSRLDTGRTAYLLLDGDVAMSVGRLLTEEATAQADLVVLDGIHLRDFDHVDLGRVRPVSGNLPVTIKSLAF
ncbi:ethanolamine ammonia-lyase reactivating factor EutA [Intrasporangium mesophilum]